MITEDSISDNNEKETLNEDVLNENPINSEISNTGITEETPEVEKISMEENPAENQAEIPEPKEEELQQEHQSDMTESTVIPEIDSEKADYNEIHPEHDDSDIDVVTTLSLPEILKEMEILVNKEDAGSHSQKFNQLKNRANQLIREETEKQKSEFISSGNPEENFSFEHTSLAKVSELINIFRKKSDEYHKIQQENQSKNLQARQNIIEKLKNLYTNTEIGTNLFKAIREIKEEWKNAGQVAKSEFKLLNNNYFHHLNQFYQILDMNKEYMELEYAHNLEKRQHIIKRAKELENETSVQKALNELQYLHKLWKEEAEPVAEEFRETTWEEFREISNKIHNRKAELSEQIEILQIENLEKKNKIIEEIRKITSPEKTPNHNYWQNAIKKIEELRSEFLKLGSVPKKISNQNWNEFKNQLRNFNTTKNEFYKELKNSQQTNLDEKLKLIQAAKDNMLSEDWEIVVPLFKKLQDDWRKIGHVPRSMTNKVWNEFRESCNTFFNNYREKTNAINDNWKENFKNKKQLLDELKEVGNEEKSAEEIEKIKNKWNNIGKVPRDKITINSEFNKALREKLKLNKMNEYELKEEGLSGNQLTDKARKIKNQISDIEAEISKMENNVAFFSNSSRENPLLKDTFDKIDEKKSQLEGMKQTLHQILTSEN